MADRLLAHLPPHPHTTLTGLVQTNNSRILQNLLDKNILSNAPVRSQLVAESGCYK